MCLLLFCEKTQPSNPFDTETRLLCQNLWERWLLGKLSESSVFFLSLPVTRLCQAVLLQKPDFCVQKTLGKVLTWEFV